MRKMTLGQPSGAKILDVYIPLLVLSSNGIVPEGDGGHSTRNTIHRTRRTTPVSKPLSPHFELSNPLGSRISGARHGSFQARSGS